MSIVSAEEVPLVASEPRERMGQLAAGVVGRAWLWFIAGCLIITILPMAFGWRPYVVESGSMTPRLKVGDVVLAAPDQNPQELLGRITVFTDPALPDTVKTHRVVQIAPDGTLVTKGDANVTADPVHVQLDQVRGLGRLLVRFVGLPLIWVQTGQWLWLLLFLASLVLAGVAVSRDRDEEDEDERDDDDAEDSDGVDPVQGQVADEPRKQSSAGGRRVDDFLTFVPMPVRRWSLKTGYAVVLAAALILPTSQAAFSATSSNSADSWTVPNWSYTAAIQALSPYLYWKLDETGTAGTAADSSGNARTGTYNTNGGATYFTRLAGTGALVTDTPNNAVTLTNPNSCINTTATTAINAPSTVSVIAWFKAPSTYTTGGKLLGFENPRTGVAIAGSGGTYDRHLYMDGNGRILFGVYNGGYDVVSSAAGLNNNAWHMAVGTMGPGGMSLYIDGTLVGTNANNAGEATTGFWRAGCGNLAGWATGWTGPNAPSSSSATAVNFPFQGSLDELTVFNSVLTPSQISFLYFTH